MSDLISRSALLEMLEDYITYDSFDLYKEEPLINLSFEQLEDIIGNQPTAYNVDKVVEELEDAVKDYLFYPKLNKRIPYISLDKAIEIVRKGGV